MKQLIAITLPLFYEGEDQAIEALFESGLQRLHIRKPGATNEEMERLIKQIPVKYHAKIVLHESFDLLKQYQLGGIHLNKRNPNLPQELNGSISCSCHTLDEVIANKTYDYLFLSPIFDSISKEGYRAKLTMEQLLRADRLGIISSRVIALGGIDVARMPTINRFSFGGVAVIGSLWNDISIQGVNPQTINKLTIRFKKLKNTLK